MKKAFFDVVVGDKVSLNIQVNRSQVTTTQNGKDQDAITIIYTVIVTFLAVLTHHRLSHLFSRVLFSSILFISCLCSNLQSIVLRNNINNMQPTNTDMARNYCPTFNLINVFCCTIKIPRNKSTENHKL